MPNTPKPGQQKHLALVLALIFAFTVLPALAFADAGDQEWDYFKVATGSSVDSDADYVHSSSGFTVESDLFTEEKEYIGDDSKDNDTPISTDNNYLCSVIGDSHSGNTETQAVLNDRFGGDYAFRSIDGITTVNYHAWGGKRTNVVKDNVVGGPYGAYEGADFVVIMAGTNNIDFERYYDLDALVREMTSDIQEIIDWVLGNDYDTNVRPSIIVSGIPPFLDPNLTWRAQVFNDYMRDNLDRYDVYTDANWWDFVVTDPVDGNHANPELYKDNKHPNDDGAYMVAENWFEAVDALYDYTRITDNQYIHQGPWYHYKGSEPINNNTDEDNNSNNDNNNNNNDSDSGNTGGGDNNNGNDNNNNNDNNNDDNNTVAIILPGFDDDGR